MKIDFKKKILGSQRETAEAKKELRSVYIREDTKEKGVGGGQRIKGTSTYLNFC